jgi:hypothetical protein
MIKIFKGQNTEGQGARLASAVRKNAQQNELVDKEVEQVVMKNQQNFVG